ncbi:MAG: hypothetical protein KJ737_11585 [Proteobacteria bacterium]|nr:hypothetical protein [Pseudomonadota bacterium]
MKRCTRCILPSTYRNIKFNADGSCNYCETFDKIKDRLTNYEELGKLFNQRIDLLKGKYEYDVLAGLSGGKDSSYIVYVLKEVYGLNVLSFTFDNHFLTDYGRRNIDSLVKKLDVDHFYHQIDWPLQKEFYRKATMGLGLPCVACSQMGFALMYKIAYDRKIPLVIHGRSTHQMFKELLPGSRDTFLPLIKSNLTPYTVEDIKKTQLTALEKMDYYLKKILDENAYNKFMTLYLPDMEEFKKAEIVPELLGFFLFHPYDEDMLKDTLEKNIGWQRPDNDKSLSHNDCAIHDAAAYIYSESLSYPLIAQELSTAIRLGEITRENALKRLHAETCLKSWPEASMNIFMKELDLTGSELKKALKVNKIKHKLLRQYLRVNAFFKKPEFEF